MVQHVWKSTKGILFVSFKSILQFQSSTKIIDDVHRPSLVHSAQVKHVGRETFSRSKEVDRVVVGNLQLIPSDPQCQSN